MSVYCPYCHERVAQAKNVDGPNFCPTCRKLFYVPEERPTPRWIWGVLLVLAGNCQLVNLGQ